MFGNCYPPRETILINYSLESDDALINEVVETIWNLLPINKTKKESLKKGLLKVLILNLIRAHRQGVSLAVPLTSNRFSKNHKRYREPIERYTLFKNIIDGLIVAKLIDFEKGSQYYGIVSRCYPSKQLLGYLTNVKFKPKSIKRKPPPEVIELRNDDGDAIDYKDTPDTTKMRKILHRINSSREKYELSLKYVPLKLLNKQRKDGKTLKDTLRNYTDDDLDNLKVDSKRRVRKISLSTTYLKRIFNIQFDKGGRYYSGLETFMPKELRKHLYINNRPTVEKDFQGLHIRMVYHLKGLQYKADPYQVLKNRQMRKFFKLVGTVCWNTKRRSSAVKAVYSKLSKGELVIKGFGNINYKKVKKYIDQWENKHNLIRKEMYTEKGGTLQFLDSKIMTRVLEYFNNKGIPVLPVHDSIIIPKKYEQELKAQMIETYKAEMGPEFEPIVK